MRTVEWSYKQNSLKMIDQRLLPGEFKMISFNDHRQVAQAITDMVVRGAPAIAASAGFGLVLEAMQSKGGYATSLRADLKNAAETLQAAHPTAVNLTWALKRVLGVAAETEGSSDDVRAAVLAGAQRIADEDVDINKQMARHGAAMIDDGDTVIHHCNKGALATVDGGDSSGSDSNGS